jgi:hypothetical protein
LFFTALQATHGGNGKFFWIDRKRRVLIVSFLHFKKIIEEKQRNEGLLGTIFLFDMGGVRRVTIDRPRYLGKLPR